MPAKRQLAGVRAIEVARRIRGVHTKVRPAWTPHNFLGSDERSGYLNRPRAVQCAHIRPEKKRPVSAVQVLEPLLDVRRIRGVNRIERRESQPDNLILLR